MNPPEPDPGKARNVTTMIFTDEELELLYEALELAVLEDDPNTDFVALWNRIKAAR